MAMTYATISGLITRPGSNVGIRARVTATPMTTANVLKFPAEDRITWGPETAETTTGGVLSTLKVPTNHGIPELFWRLEAEPIDKLPGLPDRWLIGTYQITADARIDDLVQVDVTAVSGTMLVSVADMLADTQAARDAAGASQTAAAGSATTAQGWADAAAVSAANADSSADLAAVSETNAATSAGTATTKAGEASTSATTAAGSATAAGTSETNAAASATTATTKAGEASTSATAAQGYAQQAAGSVSLVAWAPGTVYAAGDVRQAPEGSTVRRNTNGTSGASFDTTEEAAWTAVSAVAGTIEQRALTASIADVGGASFAAKNVTASIAREGEAAGFLPIGLDAANKRLYAIRDDARFTLYRTTDPQMLTWTSLHSFTEQLFTSINYCFVTATGTLLVLANTSTAGYIYRSTDGGATWTEVLNGANLASTRRSFCQIANGTIFYGQYDTVAANHTVTLYKSTDDGATFTTAKAFAGGTAGADIRHIHAVKADPFVTNRLWIATGDQDWQCKVGYSDDDGATFTWIGQGDQTWRTVDIQFDASSIYIAMDSPDDPQVAYKITRGTWVRTAISSDAGNSLYYGGMDAAGRLLWTSVFENGSHQLQREVKILAGDDAGLAPVLRIAATSTSTRTEIAPHGPDADGYFYFGVTQTPPTGVVYRTIRARLMPKQTQATEAVEPARSSGPSYMMCGLDHRVVSTTVSLGATANRVWLTKFRADRDMLAKFLTVRTGATVGGNLCVGIYAADGTSGAPLTLLGRSASTAMTTATTNQQFTLQTFPFLRAGTEYWVAVQSDSTAGVQLVGVGSSFATTGQMCRFADTTFPMPAVLGSSSVTTNSFVVVATP